MSMDDLLQSILGGADASANPQEGGPLPGMLEELLGGMGQQRDGSSAAAGDAGGFGDILGAILGGAGQSSRQAPAAAGGTGGLGDILGAILGGGGGQPAGGLADILGAILGGAGQPSAAPDMSPVVDGVASKLNISSTIAQMIVTFVLGKLMGGLGQAGGSLPASPAQDYGRHAQPASAPDLDGLLEQMSGDSQMAAELAQQTGLDQNTAMQGLQQVLGMLGGQKAPAQPQHGGLDGLLQNW